MAAASEPTKFVPIAIDGKSARRANRANAIGCLCVVRAWATSNRLNLGRVVVPDETSEVGVIPTLLRMQDLAGITKPPDAVEVDHLHVPSAPPSRRRA